MTSDDPISQADDICGITLQIRKWFGPVNPLGDTFRRGAYFEWLREQDSDMPARMCAFATLSDIAAEVVRIHAEREAAKRPKCPDDWLPPGPWQPYARRIDETSTRIEAAIPLPPQCGLSDGSRMVDYLTRCGSPAVRRLLHAFDVTDERKQDNSVALIHMANNKAIAYAATPWAGSNLVCWLTTREAKR